MADALTLFKQHFGHTPVHVLRAPTRLALLGDHADANEGPALSIAVNRYVSIAAAPRHDGKVELHTPSGTEQFWISDLYRNPATPWADRTKAVLEHLRKRGVGFAGFNAAIHHDASLAPDAAAAALDVAVALMVRRLHPFTLAEVGLAQPPKPNAKNELPPPAPAEKLRYAKLCHAAASSTGAPASLLDPITSLFGKAWHAVNIDFRFLTVEHAPLIGEAVVICDAGPSPGTAASNPDDIRRNCESAARKLGAKSLRSVEPKFLHANKSALDPREFACALYIVGETARAAAAERALRDEDHRQFGQYLTLSHQSARENLGIHSAETDLLVALANAQPGCLGARRAGTGGNSTFNLVAHHQAEPFMRNVAQQFEDRTGAKPKVALCQIVDGAA